jgi:hypothetical protein
MYHVCVTYRYGYNIHLDVLRADLTVTSAQDEMKNNEVIIDRILRLTRKASTNSRTRISVLSFFCHVSKSLSTTLVSALEQMFRFSRLVTFILKEGVKLIYAVLY